MFMAVSPESIPENPIDFRAPPPSPIASGRRSCVTNDDVLTEFLEHSLRVPDLVLPDKIFPRQKIVETPPRIDFESLKSEESDSVSRMLDSMARIGCFQLVNYGVSSEFMRLVLSMAAGVFRVPQVKRGLVTRSPEKVYGFEEVHGDQEEINELSEEFVWCKNESLKMDMEGVWPDGYSNFSEIMEILFSDIEEVASIILKVLQKNSQKKSMCRSDDDDDDLMQGQDQVGSVCYLYKHKCNVLADRWANSLGYDVIRMLIRGTDHSHALCLHICDGSSDFHVYSKKGWVSFCPGKGSIVVTVGDQTQALSGGLYKHVVGRPIFKGEEKEEHISMAFLYSPSSSSSSNNNNTSIPTTSNTTATVSRSTKPEKGKSISLGQQVILAILFTLVYQLLVYVCKKF